MLNHAFQFVGTVIFLIGAENLRSQKAVEQIGALAAGKRDVPCRGAVVEHVVYRIEKPASIETPFHQRLSPMIC